MSNGRGKDVHVAVDVRVSPIHGRGLFAAEAIPEDTLILQARGRRVKRNGPYVLWLADEEGRDLGLRVSNEAMYVNHADDANACFYDDELWSVRCIEPGEEITHDYGQEP